MNQENHLNNLFLQPNDPDFHLDLQIPDLYDDEAFGMSKIKNQGWQNQNYCDYSNSHMIVIESSCSDDQEELSFINHSYIKDTKKALDQFHELKVCYERPVVKLQQPPNHNKITSIDENNITTKTVKKRSIKKPRILNTLRKHHQLNNLKNISYQVCDFVGCSKFITYSQLFNKFIGDNEKQAKNLRRRMYDVINVLSSAKVLQKRGLTLQRYNSLMSNINLKAQKTLTINTQNIKQQRIKKIEQEYKQKQRTLQQKKRILQQLKINKRKLQSLRKRNKSKQQQFPLQQRIYFPLVFTIRHENTQFQIQRSTVKIYNYRNMEQQEFGIKEEDDQRQKVYYREMDVLQFLKTRKRRTVASVNSEVTLRKKDYKYRKNYTQNQAIQNVNLMQINQMNNQKNTEIDLNGNHSMN